MRRSLLIAVRALCVRSKMPGGAMVSSAGKSVPGVVTVVALAVVVWLVRVPGFTFVFLPPVLLGVGVGVVARYSTARPGVLVATAVATTAILFGVAVARWSSYGLHGEGFGSAIAVGLCVVAEAALATVVGVRVGRERRDRQGVGARSG